MKYCTNCHVNVNKKHTHCPLCGSYLDERNDNDNCTAYKPVEEYVSRPTVQYQPKVNFLQTKFNKIVVLLMIICFVINLIVTPSSLWSGYVIIGCVMIMLGVIMPITDKLRIQQIIRTETWLLTVTGVLLELVVTKFRFTWLTVNTILPWVYVAGIVCCDLLIIFVRHKNKSLFTTLVFCTAFAVAPQCTLWIANALGVYDGNMLTTLLIMFASIANLVIVFVVCSRSLKEEMDRNFNL